MDEAAELNMDDEAFNTPWLSDGRYWIDEASFDGLAPLDGRYTLGGRVLSEDANTTAAVDDRGIRAGRLARKL